MVGTVSITSSLDLLFLKFSKIIGINLVQYANLPDLSVVLAVIQTYTKNIGWVRA